MNENYKSDFEKAFEKESEKLEKMRKNQMFWGKVLVILVALYALSQVALLIIKIIEYREKYYPK